MAVKNITDVQKKIVWAISKKLGLNKEDLYASIFGMFEVERMSALSFAQAELLIGQMRRRSENLGPDKLTEPQYTKIMAMARKFGWKADGLRSYLRKVAKVDEIRWLTVEQARNVITGMEKIRAYNEKHETERADGV